MDLDNLGRTQAAGDLKPVTPRLGRPFPTLKVLTIMLALATIAATVCALYYGHQTARLKDIRQQEHDYVKALEGRQFKLAPAAGMKFFRPDSLNGQAGEECQELVLTLGSTKLGRVTHFGESVTFWDGPEIRLIGGGDLGVVELAPATDDGNPAIDKERRRREEIQWGVCRVLEYAINEFGKQDPGWVISAYYVISPGNSSRAYCLGHPAGSMVITVSPHASRPNQYAVACTYSFNSCPLRNGSFFGAAGIHLQGQREYFTPKM